MQQIQREGSIIGTDKGLITVILAGGMGKRMNSPLPKVLHPLAGKLIINYVIDLAHEVGSERVALVVGYRRDEIKAATAGMGVEWAVQQKPLGTADAVKACSHIFASYHGEVLVLSGDVPLLKAVTIRRARALHHESDAAATVFTFRPADPAGYGRIIRGERGELLKIVEQKDASAEELDVGEVNAGIYLFRADALNRAIPSVTNDNAAGEYYLTDTIAILRDGGARISAYLVADPAEVAGVNDRPQLEELEKLYRGRL